MCDAAVDRELSPQTVLKHEHSFSTNFSVLTDCHIAALLLSFFDLL